MSRNAILLAGIFLTALVGGVAIFTPSRSTSAHSPDSAQQRHSQVTPVQLPPPLNAGDARHTDSAELGKRETKTSPKLDESDTAKAIIEQNAAWLFQRDSNNRPIRDDAGERLLSPLGQRYSFFVSMAEQHGIRGVVSRHAWAITKLTEELEGLQPPVHGLPAPANNLLPALEGCFIIADNGQYLGRITGNRFDSESIINEFGKYGSKYSSTSIFNEFGQYGGGIALQSPFNSISLSPPRVFTRNGGFLGYLTVNKLNVPWINPHVLGALLRAN